MFFLRRQAHTNPFLKDFNILEFHDKIALENCIFIHKSFKQQLPQPLHFPQIFIPTTQGGQTGLDFPQIFIPTTQGGQIWAV